MQSSCEGGSVNGKIRAANILKHPFQEEGVIVKKFLAVLISLTLLAGLLVSGMTFAYAEEDEADYVRFTATGNDPYATFKFSSEGKHANIDPDTVKWAAIRYRTISEVDNTGVPFKGQLYVSPAAEPFVPITYNFSKNWETAIIDCSAVAQSTTLDSIWDSESYKTTSTIRFDPLESDRDAEAELLEDEAVVSDGDQIDVAWIAFFEKEEDAKAYTGAQDTPYCILDAASLAKFTGGYHISAERITNGVAAATPEPAVIHSGTYPLFDTKQATDTGYWMHPYNIDDALEVYFELPEGWMVGFSFFAFCSENEVYLDIEVVDNDDNVVWTGRQICFSNALQEVSFGGKSFPAGYYTIRFICAENPAYPDGEGQHFVLGSGMVREDLEPEDIEVYGFIGSSSKGAPNITIYLGDEDPNYATPEPAATPEPTDPPATQNPTDTPDAAPTETPGESTAKPITEETTEKPKEESGKKGCGGVIGGGFALIALAAVAIIKRKH